jgi:hypothetical protein
MNFIWEHGLAYARCTVHPKVCIKIKAWDGSLVPLWVDAVGFIKINADSYEGLLYDAVSPAHPKSFDTIEQAKAFVEEQSLIGLTVNRLGV